MKKNKTLKKRQRQRGGAGDYRKPDLTINPPYNDSLRWGCTDPNKPYKKKHATSGKPLAACISKEESKRDNLVIDTNNGLLRTLGRDEAPPINPSDYSHVESKKKCPNGYRRSTSGENKGECILRQEYLDELQRIRDERAKVLETIVKEESKERLDIIKEIDDVADVDVENKEAKLNLFSEELSQKEAIINEERKLIEAEKNENKAHLTEITKRENELFDKYTSVDDADKKILEENAAIARQKEEIEAKIRSIEIQEKEFKERVEQKSESLNVQQSKIENVLKKNTLESQRILEKNLKEQKSLAQRRTKLEEEKRSYEQTMLKLTTELEGKVANAELRELLIVTQKEENEKTALRLQLWEDELRLREEQHAESELAFFELTEKLIKKETELNEREFNVQEREEQMASLEGKITEKESQLATKIAELNQTKSQIENVLKPMVVAADRTTTKNAEERNRLNSDIDKLKQEKRNFEVEKDQIIKNAYAKIQEDLNKVKAKQTTLNNREKELNLKNVSLEQELGKAKQEIDKAVSERSKVQQDIDKLAKEKTKMDDLATRRTKIFNKLKAQLKVSEGELKASEASLEALKIKLEEEIKKAEEREGAFQGNVNRLFFLPKMYGLSYIENMRKQYYPLIEQNDILHFFDFDQTISDDKGAFGFKRGDSVTKFTRGGQETLDMLNGFTRDGMRWYISTAKYPDAVKSSVYSNIVQRRINLSKIPIVEGDTFQEPVIQEADNNFGVKLVKDADLRVAEMSDFVSPEGKKKISYFNNVLTTSPDQANVGLDKWYSVRFVLDNIKKSGGKMPQLIVFTDDSAANVYNLFKLEGLPKDFFYGVSFMGVIYEPNGVPETGFYETMEKINNEKQFKLIYPDDYIVEGPAMTEYQIMEYQLRRETKYGTPIEEGEKEEPIVLSKQKLEKIMNIISGLGQNKKNLPSISETKFREFLKIKGVLMDDQNAVIEGEFNKLCEEVKQVLIRKGLYDPKKPDGNTRYFLNKMTENKEEEVREEISSIYREFLPPIPSYDVLYDDPTKMSKSFALQNTTDVVNNVLIPRVLIKPENIASVEEKRPWSNYLSTVGNKVLAKDSALDTLFAPGTITAVYNNPTKYEILSSTQKKNVKQSVNQCLENFMSVPTFAPNKLIPLPKTMKAITIENLIQFLKRKYGPGQKDEDASKYELLPKDKKDYVSGSLNRIKLIDTATFDALCSNYDKTSINDLLRQEKIQVGKQIVETKVQKVDPSIKYEEIKAEIRNLKGKELSNAEATKLSDLEDEILKIEFKNPLLKNPPKKVDVSSADVSPLTEEQNGKYKKMKTMLPEGAIRQKMTAEGIHKTIIDAFFTANKGGRRTRKKRRPKRRRNTKRN
jgi:hypothetical protein